MRRFSTILLYVTIAFLLLWQLPWCYNFFIVKPEKTPFTLYSFVIGDFAQMGQEEGPVLPAGFGGPTRKKRNIEGPVRWE